MGRLPGWLRYGAHSMPPALLPAICVVQAPVVKGRRAAADDFVGAAPNMDGNWHARQRATFVPQRALAGAG